jgi:hypothetical protein
MNTESLLKLMILTERIHMRFLSKIVTFSFFLLVSLCGEVRAAEAGGLESKEAAELPVHVVPFAKDAVERYFYEQIAGAAATGSLTLREARDLIKMREYAGSPEVQEILRAFLADEEVHKFLLAEKRYPLGRALSEEEARELLALWKEGMPEKVIAQIASMPLGAQLKEALSFRRQSIAEVCKRYGFDVAQSHNTYVLIHREHKIVLKIPMFNWHNPDLKGERAGERSVWQNVSRLLYATRIIECCEKRYLNHVIPVQKWFVSFPDRGEEVDILHDDNSGIIAERVFGPKGKVLLHNMMEMALLGNVESLELLRQILIVIKHSRLWNVTPENVVFTGPFQVAFIDTEKPGLGGQDDAFFFHQNSKEVAGHIDAGCGSFSEALTTNKEDAGRLRLCFLLFVATEDDSIEHLAECLDRYRS